MPPSVTATTTKNKPKKEARDIRTEAQKIANSIKTEGQTSVETKAIANGIQRGIELFLRQQSEKTRELDKRVKKVKQLANKLVHDKSEEEQIAMTEEVKPKLPWILLITSWLLFLFFEGSKKWLF